MGHTKVAHKFIRIGRAKQNPGLLFGAVCLGPYVALEFGCLQKAKRDDMGMKMICTSAPDVSQIFLIRPK